MTEQKIMPKARYGSWGYFLLIVGLAGIIAFLIFINQESLNKPGISAQKIWTIWGVAFAVLLFGLIGSPVWWRWKQRRNQAVYKPQMSGEKLAPSSVVGGGSGQLFSSLKNHLRIRYRFFWRNKVRLLLVTGDETAINQLVPNLQASQWLEGNRTVLIYGGSQLYRAEQLLTGLGEVLQRLELKHLSQLDTLRTLMRNSAVRLENSDGITSTGSNIQPGIVLPATVMNAATASTRDFAGGPDEETSESAVKWVYVAQPEQQPNVEVLSTMPAPVKKWKSFAAGMCTMLVVSVATVWGWQHFHQPVPLQTQLTASLVPFPAPLTSELLDMSRQQAPLPQVLITQTQQQLARLDKLPPDWNIDYSRQLLEKVRVLWPEQAKPLIQHWQQRLNAAALPAEQLNGWSQGMATLQKLSDRLNELDGQKGKYLTVSELKSVVFSAIQSFNQSIPAEEQLRVLSQNPAGEPLPAAARAQLEMHLKQLIARYAEIKQDALK
ncbi:VasL domain-containing protein [Pantoea agglomerans]|uniref:VasL domain-containing protein n=1 Tax=Enterobacter agglomerans TaxID=549 RepID=UPI000DFE39A5|nr:VasL domain-containing protein [Pantoea agglomerans]SUB06471.1 ImpA domain protein [Pantoea agglomerans]